MPKWIFDIAVGRSLRADAKAAYNAQARYWREEFELKPLTSAPRWQPTFGEFGTVGGLVGVGFEAYIRILHPIGSDGDVPRRWASLEGARIHEPEWRPDMDASGHRYAREAFNDTLPEGWIPQVVRTALDPLLRDWVQLDRDDRVIQAVWDGYSLNAAGATTMRINQPERELIPFVGPFNHIVELDDWPHTPALVFPSNGAWSLACDVDAVSTYIGCATQRAQQLFGHPDLEAVPAAAEDLYG